MNESTSVANPNLPKRRLIIGCGFLGRQIAAGWLAGGDRVFATTRHREVDLQSLGIVPIRADATDAAGIPKLPDCDTVVYSVGFDRTAGHSMRDVYVRGLANLLAAMPAGGTLIYVSSTGVYGDAAGGWVDETTAVNPTDESGRIVCEAEELLHSERPEAIILRFAGIYGPGRLLRRIDATMRGAPIAGDPDTWLNLIHVKDGAAAVLAAAKRGEPSQIYNICDGAPVRRGDFFAELARQLGAPPPRFDGTAGRARGNRRISNAKMRKELGLPLTYPSFRDGLAAI